MVRRSASAAGASRMIEVWKMPLFKGWRQRAGSRHLIALHGDNPPAACSRSVPPTQGTGWHDAGAITRASPALWRWTGHSGQYRRTVLSHAASSIQQPAAHGDIGTVLLWNGETERAIPFKRRG